MSLVINLDGLVLYLLADPADRLTVIERVVRHANRTGVDMRGLLSERLIGSVNSSLELAEFNLRRSTFVSVETVTGEDAPAYLSACEAVERLSRVAGWGGSDERRAILLVDLDGVFSAFSAASEMMSFVYHLEREHKNSGRVVCCIVSPGSLPKSLPSDFFGLFSMWSVGELESREGSEMLDRVSEQLALSFPEFRQRLLAAARDDEALSLVPRLLEDLRYGILVVDRGFTIRFCSHRAAALLGRAPADLTDRALTGCIDGVDLVTVKHECEKLTPVKTNQSPFVASWRISSGVYEPREVTADPLRSAHQIVGYIITLSNVEPIRGPRAVYRQLKEDKAGGRAEPVGERVTLGEDDSISRDLHGTQITRREHEIILLILKGKANRQIAEHLGIAEVTVKKHLTSVYRKLRITSRHELIVSFSRPGGAL